ncbi:MAG: response regulator [bacterium]|nr:response regulator [bacterium]
MKKILVVDDQPNLIKIVSIKLKKLGYQVISAENGQMGLEKCKSELPDLIIMDIMMPVMDGFTAAAKIKEDPDTKNIPLVFLSAKGQEQDRIQARELGAVDFIGKPFSPKVLVQRIEKLLEE